MRLRQAPTRGEGDFFSLQQCQIILRPGKERRGGVLSLWTSGIGKRKVCKHTHTHTHTMYTHWFTLRLCPDSRGLSWKEFSFPRRQENQKKKGNYCERSERSCLALAVRFLLANLYVCRGNYSKPLGSDYTYFPLSTIVKNNNSQSCVLQEKQMNIVEMDMFEVECFHN